MRLFMKKWSTFRTTRRINHTAAPLTAGGLAIHGSGIPNRTTLCSAPALKSPWLLANFHFGCFSARESCRSHSFPAQIPGQGNPAPLGRGNHEEKHHPVCTALGLTSAWWVRACFGFTQSTDVPAPKSDSHWRTARFGRALHSPKRGLEENVVTIASRNKTEQQLSEPFIPALP